MPQDPYLVIFQAKDPTHGQMKAFLRNMMRFPEICLELTSDRPQIDLRNDPPDHLPDWSPDALQMPISQTSDIL